MKLLITAETGRAFMPFLRKYLKQVARATRPCMKDLSIVLANDRTIKSLHKQFMNDDTVTDVLTFPIDTDARGRVTSGEVYVCVPEAIRQARSRKIPPRNEVLLYAIHGMLHLLGHDDRTDRGFRVMHRIEDDLLTQLGLGPVFAADAAPARRRRTR